MMRSCVICGQCENPISYPHLSSIEGIVYSTFFKRWEVYHEGIFIGLFLTKDSAAEQYDKIKKGEA